MPMPILECECCYQPEELLYELYADETLTRKMLLCEACLNFFDTEEIKINNWEE